MFTAKKMSLKIVYNADMSPQKWTQLSARDVSLSKWLTVEERSYLLPNGKKVDDFTVVTIADVAMIIPITKDNKIVLVNQYKPGVDSVMLQFPAGRMEPKYKNIDELALHELEEEVGIRANPNQLTKFAKFSGFSTKASEILYCYIAKDCEFNSVQRLDPTEDIEVVTVSVKEMNELVETNKIWCSQTIASWELAKKKFPDLFRE